MCALINNTVMNLTTKEIVIHNSKVVGDSRDGVKNAKMFSNNKELNNEEVCIFTQPHNGGIELRIQGNLKNSKLTILIDLDANQLETLANLLEPYITSAK